MPFPEFERPSPNRGEGGHEGLGVLFHHSGLGFADTIALMTDPASRVSYHCLIGPEGERCTLVPDAGIAWHAGASAFRGRERCNDFLLGVVLGRHLRRPALGPPDRLRPGMARAPLAGARLGPRLPHRPPPGLAREEARPQPRGMGPAAGGGRRAFRGRVRAQPRFHVEIGARRPHKNSAAVPMNLPSDTPRLPKWIFFLGYVSLLGLAWIIHDGSNHRGRGAPSSRLWSASPLRPSSSRSPSWRTTRTARTRPWTTARGRSRRWPPPSPPRPSR